MIVGQRNGPVMCECETAQWPLGWLAGAEGRKAGAARAHRAALPLQEGLEARDAGVAVLPELVVPRGLPWLQADVGRQHLRQHRALIHPAPRTTTTGQRDTRM